MTAPWETIIKVYRKQLGVTSFSTLKEYEQNFIAFLRAKKFYTDAGMQTAALENFALDIINSIINNIATQDKGLIESPSPQSREQFLVILEQQR